MHYIRNIVTDAKLKYHLNHIVLDCVQKRESPAFHRYLSECVAIADEHPELVLTAIRTQLAFNHPENAYGGLLLLEQLVSLCNYCFHLALARDYAVQDSILHLAMRRGEGEAHWKMQRLARLTLLEYSRVFVDDRDLLRLSALASSFEHRTGKNLLRCLNMQNRRVRFREVEDVDIIPISPKECAGYTGSVVGRPVRPLQLSAAPEVWPCHVCTYLNAPSARRCAACETTRSADSTAHSSSLRTTPMLSPSEAPRPTTGERRRTPPALALPPHEEQGVSRGSSGLSCEGSSSHLTNTRETPLNAIAVSGNPPQPSQGPPPACYADPTVKIEVASTMATSTQLPGMQKPTLPSTHTDGNRENIREGGCDGSTVAPCDAHPPEPTDEESGLERYGVCRSAETSDQSESDPHQLCH